jgi:hypothetical protein
LSAGRIEPPADGVHFSRMTDRVNVGANALWHTQGSRAAPC